MQNKKMNVIDCNAWYGENSLNRNLSVDISNLKKYISLLKSIVESPKVLISSFYSLQCDPIEGDVKLKEILELLKPDFFGNLIFPNYFIICKKEFKKYLLEMYSFGFRCIRLFPKMHKYLIDDWAFDYFLSILNDLRFPTMISLDELDITGNKAINWEIIYRIATKFNDIPFIIDGANSKELMFSGYFHQILSKTKNVYLETHNLLGFNQIEELTESFTSSRLILGSYFPIYPELLSIERIKLARISDDDKLKILFSNLNKILSDIKIS